MQAWQEIFYCVPQMFYPDTQLMKSSLGAVAQRLTMESMGLVPTFNRQMRENRAINRDARTTAGQLGRPVLPLLWIKTLQRRRGVVSQLLFLAGHVIGEDLARCIALRCEVLDPLPH